MNYVPRDGGNTFKGLLFVSGANGSMQSTNYTTIEDDPVTSLEARGLRTQPGALSKVYDFNPGYGGPIVKDKLWWFASARWTKAENFVTQNYPNKNFVPGVTPPTLFNNTTMTYTPDQTQPLATTLGRRRRFQGADAASVLAGHAEEQDRRLLQQQGATVPQRHDRRPRTKALNDAYFFPFSDQLLQWSAPVSNRLLLEAGLWHHQETWGGAISPFDLVDPLADRRHR